MDKLFIFFCFIANSIIVIELALTLFGSTRSNKIVLLVALLSGSFDYLVRNIIVPTFNLYNGLHIITGLIFTIIILKYILKLNFIGAISVTILTYVLSGIGEFLMFIILMLFTNIRSFENEVLISFYALLGTLILIIPTYYLKRKNIQLIKLHIEK